MKTRLALFALALSLSHCPASLWAQTTGPHRIGAISITPEGQPLLVLEGQAATAFKSYFDLFQVETSANLTDWSWLATVIRTNATTNAVLFRETRSAEGNARFYRTRPEAVITPFLPPRGRHAVGTFSRMLTDPSRTNRFGVRPNSSFMVTFWYPAQVQSPGVITLAPYCDRQLAERSAYWGSYTNRVPALVSYAVPGGPIEASLGPLPVIIYSHGLGDKEGRSTRTENTEKAQELASQGYVVVSLDHTDAYGLVLPPDQLIMGRNAWSFGFLKDRLRDISFLLDRLVEWNTEDEVFQGRIDLERVGIMGWSWGGGTAAEACQLEDRLKAAVLLDAYFDSAATALRNGLGKPFLTMMNPGGSGDNATLFNKSQKDAYQLSVKDASHEMFTDNAWIVNPSAASRRRALAMNACLVSFFNKHLKGTDDSLINAPSGTLPDVVSFRKK